MGASESFYARLPEFTEFVEVTDVAHYRPVPSDWSVVITDVIGSIRKLTAKIESTIGRTLIKSG
ncbi:MAG TPA: DUF3095 family protein [Enhygromyxa sp.]|nr:DUF3095 family protein [Enhygromyxa sp.]